VDGSVIGEDVRAGQTDRSASHCASWRIGTEKRAARRLEDLREGSRSPRSETVSFRRVSSFAPRIPLANVADDGVTKAYGMIFDTALRYLKRMAFPSRRNRDALREEYGCQRCPKGATGPFSGALRVIPRDALTAASDRGIGSANGNRTRFAPLHLIPLHPNSLTLGPTRLSNPLAKYRWRGVV
jgi:hypothetical protein